MDESRDSKKHEHLCRWQEAIVYNAGSPLALLPKRTEKKRNTKLSRTTQQALDKTKVVTRLYRGNTVYITRIH